jgi:hypothetical protein
VRREMDASERAVEHQNAGSPPDGPPTAPGNGGAG